MNVTSTHPDTFYGVYSPVAVSGHFYAEVDFGKDENTALAIIHEKNGKPDTDNFTMITVDRNKDGKIVVSLKDRQDGIDNILDNTGRLGKKRYTHVLDNQYSVPFTKTNKKFRIFRDDASGFFHLYYSVSKEIRGKQADGWMELAPSKDWSKPNQKFYVALACTSGNSPAKAQFNSVKIVQKPTHDLDDTDTGFKATKRDYNWSGFTGDAIVITFGDEFEFHNKDCKFVFWSETNYIPAWHMNDQLLLSYEFVEMWGHGDRKKNRGCFEPMSDRLLRWSSVDILEDNNVRKVIKWHYVLCNPHYELPNKSQSNDLPEVDEYWTFYPDGTGLRQIIFKPNLDSGFRNIHEIMEIIAIAGSLTHPGDHLASPAITILDMGKELRTYIPGLPLDKDIQNWPQVISSANFKNAPDAFCAFSVDNNIPDTFSHYPIYWDLSWHNICYKFSHWPACKEPFQFDDKSFGHWKSQPSHTCLISGQIIEGTDWNDHYELDAHGRKYRQWVSLVGLNEQGYNEGLRIKTASWLYPGKIKMLDKNCRFDNINYKQREFVFTRTGQENRCTFLLEPVEKTRITVNPVFRINNWPKLTPQVYIDNKRIAAKNNFKFAFEDNSLIIWLKGQFDSPTTFEIKSIQ